MARHIPSLFITRSFILSLAKPFGNQSAFVFFPPVSSLHDVLMELQKKQLQQLADWLTVTEERIQKMESEPSAEVLELLQKQMEEHKVKPFCIVHHEGENIRSNNKNTQLRQQLQDLF